MPAQQTSGDSRWSTLVPIAIAALGLLEIAILVLIGVNTSLWWSVLIVAIGWVIGVALVVAAGQQSIVRLRSLVRAMRGRGDVQDHLSRPAFTMLAAAFFFFPGLVTDLIGIVLLITPVQRKAVSASGMGSGSTAARRVMYRHTAPGGVIDGEIVVDAERTDRTDGDTKEPPTITQE